MDRVWSGGEFVFIRASLFSWFSSFPQEGHKNIIQQLIIFTTKMFTGSLLVCVLVALARAHEGDTSVATINSASCPENWNKFQGRCFLYVPTQMSWIEAEKNCLSMNANLASVHNAAEYEFIQEMIRGITQGYPDTWLGGTDCQENNSWLWSDGSQFVFALWFPGQPDNTDGVEHCLEMNYEDSHRWNDNTCSRLRPSVCARALGKDV